MIKILFTLSNYFKRRTKEYTFFALMILAINLLHSCKNYNENEVFSIGQPVDKFNGVSVYYNGSVGHVSGRNKTADGYNLGLKYQCVEFVKRYYYEYYNHKMPNSYGHAKDFFNKSLSDGEKNNDRNLYQYTNSSNSKPKINDILIFDGTVYNQFGHIAIISDVSENQIEIIQQNPGPFSSSRATYPLVFVNQKWIIKGKHVLGRLRK
jgi:hypothetical protein